MLANPSVVATETGTLDAGHGTLLSCGICAGADAATAVVRTGGASGTVLCALGAGIGLSAQRTFLMGVPYTNLHVTITGTAPNFDAEVGV